MTALALALLLSLAGPAPTPAPTAVATPQDAPADAVAALIAKGRQRLDAGRPDDAQPFFDRADEKSGGAFETRFWVARCLLARGHLNDAFDAIDTLRAAGLTDPGVDYLAGLALHARANEHIAQEVGGGLIEFNFRDAVAYLTAATEAAPERFGDAFLPLAEAAWYTQQNALARSAAERAVARAPEGFDEAFLLGRVAFSQYVVAKGSPDEEQAARAHWEAAHAALQRATTGAGAPADPALRTRVAEAWVQLAYALIWEQRNAEAAQPLSRAMALDPGTLNFRDLGTWLDADAVLACLERGLAGFEELNGPEAHEDSVIRWWIAWSHFSAQRWEAAEAAWMGALREFPGYADARWYIGLARYQRQDFDGAVAAMAAGWVAGQEAVVGAASTDPRGSRAILDYLIGHILGADAPPRHLEAAALAEIQTALAPEDARHWANAGLFLYRAARALEPTEGPAVARRAELLERARLAYDRALHFAPDDPGTLNDAAVVLHHGLGRDLDRARELYLRANELARARLAAGDLDPADLLLLQQVVRDSAANLEELGRAGG